MRRVLTAITVVIIVMGVSAAYGDLNVAYNSTWGFYAHDGSSPLLGSSGSGNSALIQVLASPDSTADTAYGDGGANHYLDPVGNDVWLQDFVLTEGSTADSEWGDFNQVENYLGGTYNSGWYVYCRVFQNATPDAGDWYYAASLDAQQDTTVPPGSPQSYDMSPIASAPSLDSQVQAIPEPSVVVLACIGCLAIVGRRIRRRK